MEFLTWGLPWRELKAASLYVIGNLSLNTWVHAVDVVEQALQGELLLDLLSESMDIGDNSVVLLGLSTPIFSGVPGVGDAGQVPKGNSSCTGTLGLGEGLLRVERCCRCCSTQGKH